MSAVLDILRDLYSWDVCPSAEPDPHVVAEALAAGQSVEDICSALSGRAERYPDPPRGYPGDRWQYKLYWTYGGGCHFVTLNTAQALGLAPEDAPVLSRPPARTAEDALELAFLGWHYTGQTQFIEMNTETGREEFARRERFADTQPLSWQGVDPILYRYLVISGRLPSRPAPFGVRVSEQVHGCYGMSLQMWLDNQWCGRERVPLKWKNGVLNPEWKP